MIVGLEEKEKSGFVMDVIKTMVKSLAATFNIIIGINSEQGKL